MPHFAKPRIQCSHTQSSELALNVHAYCKSGNFRENFVFANSVKKHICDVKMSRLRHVLSALVDGKVISPFLAGFIFTKLRNVKFCEIKPSRKFPNLQ